MDLFSEDVSARLGSDDVLSKVDALMDWRQFSPILKRGLGRSGVGPQGSMIRSFCSSAYSSANGMV